MNLSNKHLQKFIYMLKCTHVFIIQLNYVSFLHIYNLYRKNKSIQNNINIHMY